MKFDLKKYGIDILIVVGFAVLSLAYCYPQLQGKKLYQHDNLSWQGMAHEGMAYHEATGKDVLWSNSMFGGMPTFTTYVGATNTNYSAMIQGLLEGIGKPAYFFFIAMICFYLLTQVLGMNKWVGIIGSIAYAFSSYNGIIIGVGHETKMLTLGYLPAAIAGLYLIYKEKWLTGAALLAVTIALIFTNNHFQIIYYAALMFGCFGLAMLYIAIKESKIRSFFIASGIAIAAAGIGIAPAMPSLITTNEYAKETMRGGQSELSGHDKKVNGGLDKEYAFRWSNGIGETFCLLVPYLYGGSSDEPAEKAPKTNEITNGRMEALPTYWGPQPFLGGPVYFGAVICFLFVLGLMVVKSPHKWWMVAASIIGIVLSWGKNFESVNYFLFDHLPGLNKFRTVTMALVLPQFLFPLLGAWAINEITTHKENSAKYLKDLKIAAGITGGLCLLLGLGGSMFFNFTGAADAQYPAEIVSALKQDRASLATSSSLTCLVYILIAAGLIWAFLINKIKPIILLSGIGLIIAIDLFPVSHQYLFGLADSNFKDASEYEAAFEPREADKAILRDPDPYYRVLDLSKDTYNDAIQAYFHKCVGGYHPAKMEIYQDLIDRQMSKGYNGQVLDMLNTKYIIVANKKGGEPHVIPNPDACGNAWFVEEVKWANNADEEMSGLNAPRLGDTTVMPMDFNARKTAVMRATFKSDLGSYAFGKDSSAAIKLAQYGLDDISFTSKNSKDGLAVFSDIYYANGWKAFVDDKETPIMKADYVLRAIKIPAGTHKIEFHFHPESFYKSQKIAMIGSILIVGLCIGAIVAGFRKKEEMVAEKK